MKKWIDQLEDNAKKVHGGTFYTKGNLYSKIDYIDWSIYDDEIELRGEFTIEQLKELIKHMEKYAYNRHE